MSHVLHTCALSVTHHEILSRDLQRLSCILTPIIFTLFMLKYSRIEWSGCHGDHRASWDPACHLASGPLHSRDLSVKEENLPLKICRLSGASLYPQTQAPTTYTQPFRSSTPPFSLSFHVLSVLSFCFLFPPAICLFKSSVHCPQKLFPYPLLISASSYASRNLNLEKGEPQKELSFTFANQIRFKMVRRHESHS